MADRWRDDDRSNRGYRGGYGSESRLNESRNYRDYDRDADQRYADRDYGQGGLGGRYGRDQASAYESWDQPSDARSYDDYTRSGPGRYGSGRAGGDYGRGSYGDTGWSSRQRGADYGRDSSAYGYGPSDGYTGGGAYNYDRGDSNRSARGYQGGYQDRSYRPDTEGYRSHVGGYRGSTGYEGGSDDDRGFFARAGDEVRSWFGDEDAERRRAQDQYRGHGPKGYTRSDERIREDVNDRLSDDSRVDATDVEVSVASGEVTLTGTVRDRNQKRRAEDIAEDISGVRHVQNNLRVQQSWGGATTAATTGAGTTGLASGGTRVGGATGNSDLSSTNATSKSAN